jgi:hypothetical protein
MTPPRGRTVVRVVDGVELIDRAAFVEALALRRFDDLDDRAYYAVLEIITPEEIVDAD